MCCHSRGERAEPTGCVESTIKIRIDRIGQSPTSEETDKWEEEEVLEVTASAAKGRTAGQADAASFGGQMRARKESEMTS